MGFGLRLIWYVIVSNLCLILMKFVKNVVLLFLVFNEVLDNNIYWLVICKFDLVFDVKFMKVM